ncbi:endothelin-converting enzyme-like 1 isoform X2 [Dermacentor albipictus]|uniref:endothelin-converting enzyme-like 1 isoform X2 n=1 Tax=Dermacentor albipictus TaxID=60249 RepID=UPI0031FCD180
MANPRSLPSWIRARILNEEAEEEESASSRDKGSRACQPSHRASPRTRTSTPAAIATSFLHLPSASPYKSAMAMRAALALQRRKHSGSRKSSASSSTSSKRTSHMTTRHQHSNAKKMVIIAIVLFLTSGALLMIMIWSKPHAAIVFCNTSDCLRHATELKEAMDTSVDPCNNFYKFTCGSWKPKRGERSMVARVFADSTQIAMEEMEGPSEKAVVPKAMDYYKSCIQLRNLTPTDVELYINFKQDLGFLWPEKKQSDIDALLPLLNLTITWNINYLFQLEALPAYKRRPQTLYVTRGILSRRFLDPTWTPVTFAEVVRRYCGELGVEPPSDSSIQELKGTVEDIINAALKLPPGATTDTQIMMKEIEQLMPKRGYDWLSSLNKLYSPQFTWTSDSPVALEDEAILRSVYTLLENYKKKRQTLMEGLSFVFIRTSLWLVAGKPEMRYTSDPKASRRRWKLICLKYAAAHFGLLIAVKHIYTRYSSRVRGKLARFYQSIHRVIKEQLEDAEWIEAAIKSKATIKIDALTLDMMPEENFFSDVDLARLYRDFPSIGTSYLENYINVSKAYRLLIGHDYFISVYSKRLGDGSPSRYDYYYNNAYISLGAMEPPILYLSGTTAMQYGSFGTLIAECMVRSFDKRGVLSTGEGKRELWWDSPAYMQRVGCDLLSDRKSGGSGTTSDANTLPAGSHDPRELRFAALFPLAPALTTSFIAHRRASIKHGRYVQHRLHGLDYTDDQVFFLTYCLMTCARNITGETCNVPLRQMQKFASAFRCSPGSPMNPEKKCTFFLVTVKARFLFYSINFLGSLHCCF